MSQTDNSVRATCTEDVLLTEQLIRLIKKMGPYVRDNREWQTLSTRIDYALKQLKNAPDLQKRILDTLSEIDYVPLFRVSDNPTIRLGELSLSDTAKIGTNLYQTAVIDSITGTLSYEDSIDIILAGHCQPVFSIIEKGLRNQAKVAISPDNRYVAVVANDMLRVWDIEENKIVFEKQFPPKYDDRLLMWSKDSKHLIRTFDKGFRIIDIDDRSERCIRAHLFEEPDNVIVNNDATAFYYVHDGLIKYSNPQEESGIVDTGGLKYEYCYLMDSKVGIWAFIDNAYYQIENDKLVWKGFLDPSINPDPSQLQNVMGDHMTQELNNMKSCKSHCRIVVNGPEVIFLTDLGSHGVHIISMSIDNLETKSRRDQSPFDTYLLYDQPVKELNEEFSYSVKDLTSDKHGRFYLITNKKEIPLGTCRFDATAMIVDKKLFIHKGRTIEVYDLGSLNLLKSINAVDTDTWAIAGADPEGTVYLVKAIDVKSDIGIGSKAKLTFARLKAPDFCLSEFENSFIEVDKVWNLRFGLAIRNGYVFNYNRDGNVVEPERIERRKLRSGELGHGYTQVLDHSKFDYRMCELPGHRIAVVSLDDLDNNSLRDPRITIRIIECDTGAGMNLCDLTKQGRDKHLRISGISDMFTMNLDESCNVIVQFHSEGGDLVCSRDADTREHYPAKDEFIEGTVVSHDDVSCIIKDPSGRYIRYDAHLRPLDEVDPVEPPHDTVRNNPYSIPLNKVFKTSFGEIIQNDGVFFCLKNTE